MFSGGTNWKWSISNEEADRYSKQPIPDEFKKLVVVPSTMRGIDPKGKPLQPSPSPTISDQHPSISFLPNLDTSSSSSTPAPIAKKRSDALPNPSEVVAPPIVRGKKGSIPGLKATSTLAPRPSRSETETPPIKVPVVQPAKPQSPPILKAKRGGMITSQYRFVDSDEEGPSKRKRSDSDNVEIVEPEERRGRKKESSKGKGRRTRSSRGAEDSGMSEKAKGKRRQVNTESGSEEAVDPGSDDFQVSSLFINLINMINTCDSIYQKKPLVAFSPKSSIPRKKGSVVKLGRQIKPNTVPPEVRKKII